MKNQKLITINKLTSKHLLKILKLFRVWEENYLKFYYLYFISSLIKCYFVNLSIIIEDLRLEQKCKESIKSIVLKFFK